MGKGEVVEGSGMIRKERISDDEDVGWLAVGRVEVGGTIDDDDVGWVKDVGLDTWTGCGGWFWKVE